MTTMQTEMLVPFSDLRYLSVECRRCNAEVVVDLSKNWNISQCPVCLQQTEDALRGHIKAISVAYGQIPTLTSYGVNFRIKLAPPQSKPS